MANQDTQDWEDYQLGVQGTMTGSMHNQLGLNDQPQSYAGTSHKQPARAKNQPKAKRSQSARTVSNSDHNGLSYLVAAIAWVIAFVLLLPETGGESLFTYLLPLGAAVIAERYYKVIVTLVGVVAAVYLFNL